MRGLVLSLSLASAALVSACGGGDSPPALDRANQDNVFRDAVGTYNGPCHRHLYNEDVASDTGSIVVGTLVGRDRALVDVRYATHSDKACSAGTEVDDVTAHGEIQDLGLTKTFTQNGQTRTGKVVQFTLSRLDVRKTLFKGSLPMPGVTARMAYILDGNRLYSSYGTRQADGIGDAMSEAYATRQ